MTYTITTENGARLHYISEDAYEAACDWYNSTPKADIIAWCKNHGFSIMNENGMMIEDWADWAMYWRAVIHPEGSQ